MLVDRGGSCRRGQQTMPPLCSCCSTPWRGGGKWWSRGDNRSKSAAHSVCLDVIAASGAKLREVGTTNRTHLRDYECAIGPETGAILVVHPSNYRVQGFTAEVDLKDLAALSQRVKSAAGPRLGERCFGRSGAVEATA